MNSGPCIFCGGFGEKKAEHFFPIWSRKAYPILPRVTAFNFGTKEISDRDVGTKKVKLICGGCNNEWMSKLQTSAKNLIYDKILSTSWKRLDDQDCLILAKWIAMTTFVIDFEHRSKSVSCIEERRLLKMGKLPKDFFVWIAHRPAPLRGLSHLPYQLTDRSPLTRCLTLEYQIGKFVFLAALRTPKNFLGFQAMAKANFVQIWPEVDQSINPPFFSTPIPPRMAGKVAISAAFGLSV